MVSEIDDMSSINISERYSAFYADNDADVYYNKHMRVIVIVIVIYAELWTHIIMVYFNPNIIHITSDNFLIYVYVLACNPT